MVSTPIILSAPLALAPSATCDNILDTFFNTWSLGMPRTENVLKKIEKMNIKRKKLDAIYINILSKYKKGGNVQQVRQRLSQKLQLLNHFGH